MKFIRLSRGAHKEGIGKGCAMEAVAALNGEMWSDRPACVCPVIGAYVRVYNDFLPDTEREKYLTPDLLIRLIGTRGDLASQVARARIAADSAAKSAEYAIYRHCVATIEAMLAVGTCGPVSPLRSIEEIAPKFGGLVEVEKV